jgi:formylglycine-generating enzyme required for sulfatase activity
MKRCPQCNKELPDDARFCLQCGARQDGPAGGRARVEGSGAAAQAGGQAAGERGVALGGDAQAPIVSGDHSRAVQAETYVERQITGEADLAPEDLRTAYLHHLTSRVSRVPLSGIDPKMASDSEAHLELHAVYTGLRTLTSQECEALGQRERPGPMRGEQRRLSALEQLDCHDRLVLLGEPGSGKSTFVNFMALCMAGEILGLESANLQRLTEPLPQDREGEEEGEPERQPWTHGALLPVHVELRDFAARGLPPVGEEATAKDLWAFIVRELEDAALGAYEEPLARELLQGGGLLLLDGLDEVPEAERRREQIKQAVDDFAGTFRKCRVLVTSRTYAYQQQAWRLPEFEDAVLAPFGAGQIRRFVDRWYAHIAQLRGVQGDDAQGRAELLKRAIAASERLRGLAERPLLLTLMSSLHAWRGGSLPEKREELYADTVDLLLDWWERPKAVRDADGAYVVQQPSLAEWLRVDREKVRDLLERLAYEAHTAQPDLLGTADVPEEDLISALMGLSRNPDVKPRRLIQYLSQRAGLLVPRGVGVYTFPHRTFQEYLAACYLTDADYPEGVAELARDDPNRWREVTLLAGAKAARGTASAVWSLADALCDHPLDEGEDQSETNAWGALLAGQALVESADLDDVSRRNRAKVERVVGHLVRLLEEGKLPAVERAAAGNALAVLGDPRPGVGLDPGSGLPDVLWRPVPAGPFVMGTREDSIPALLEAFGGERDWYEWETPQHDQQVQEPYGISRYPVTNAQFAAFVEAGGYCDERYWTSAAREGVWRGGKVKGWRDDEPREGPYDYGEPFNLPNHPVVGVTWYEAVAFCLWLTHVLRERGDLDDNQQIILPSEPEWEKAARGTDRRRFPWGPEPDPDRANYSDTGIGATSAVGCFPQGASPYGVEDLSGNVLEWCRTVWEASYEGYRNDNNLRGASTRVLRGGAFYYPGGRVRCAHRYWDGPCGRDGDLGFRVVVAPFSPTSGP